MTLRVAPISPRIRGLLFDENRQVEEPHWEYDWATTGIRVMNVHRVKSTNRFHLKQETPSCIAAPTDSEHQHATCANMQMGQSESTSAERTRELAGLLDRNMFLHGLQNILNQELIDNRLAVLLEVFQNGSIGLFTFKASAMSHDNQDAQLIV